MPIHLHLPNNTTTPLFTITDELYDTLNSSFNILEKKTGIFIDPYGDSRLTWQHAALLRQIITDEIVGKQLMVNKSITDFTGFLKKLIDEQTDIELIGD